MRLRFFRPWVWAIGMEGFPTPQKQFFDMINDFVKVIGITYL